MLAGLKSLKTLLIHPATLFLLYVALVPLTLKLFFNYLSTAHPSENYFFVACCPKHHVNFIEMDYFKKLSQHIGILKKIRSLLPHKQRILYYNSMIKPVFDYVNVIWTTCNKDNLGRVLKLQKRAARIILNAVRRAPSVPLFNCLKWLPFYEDAN